MSAETVHWIDWYAVTENDLPEGDRPEGRVYLGCESCEHLLPEISVMLTGIKRVLDGGHQVTLVTPVVGESGLEKLANLFDALAGFGKPIEIVCNDWGVYETVLTHKNCIPVIGRLLSGQNTDPRFASITDESFQKKGEKVIIHVDDTPVNLVYQPPSEELVQHLRSAAVMNSTFLDYLSPLGVSRIEVSNLLQGINVKVPDNWYVTLHVPTVPVALRRCPKSGPIPCGMACKRSIQKLELPDFRVPLYLSPGEVYYCNQNLAGLEENPVIDRVVIKKF